MATIVEAHLGESIPYKVLYQKTETVERHSWTDERSIVGLVCEAATTHSHADGALDLLRAAHRHWDGIGWPEDKAYIAMLAMAIELLEVKT